MITFALSYMASWVYSVSQNKVSPSEKKYKNTSHNFRTIVFIYNINICPIFVRVLKISLVLTYPIHHVHLDHDMWPYLLLYQLIQFTMYT